MLIKYEIDTKADQNLLEAIEELKQSVNDYGPFDGYAERRLAQAKVNAVNNVLDECTGIIFEYLNNRIMLHEK